MFIIFILFCLLISSINAVPIACGLVCTTCCSGQWFWIPIMIPPCAATCIVHCVPAPIPPIPTPVDLGAMCQILGMASLLLPTP